jgi:hypothetical protein
MLEAGPNREFLMTFYIRVPLGSGDTVSSKTERVSSRDNATELEYADAEDFRLQAFMTWTEFNWQIEKVSATKYIVRGEGT